MRIRAVAGWSAAGEDPGRWLERLEAGERGLDAPGADRPEAVTPGDWRRLSRLSRWAVAGAARVLEAAPELDREQLPLVWGTGLGELAQTEAFLTRLVEEGIALASPARFQGSVFHAAAGAISLALGLRGPTETLSAGDETGLAALIRGVELLDDGAPAALVVAGDERSPWRLRAAELWGAPPPGEGLAALLLCAEGPGAPLRIEAGRAALAGEGDRIRWVGPNGRPLPDVQEGLGASPVLGLLAAAALAAGGGGALELQHAGRRLHLRIGSGDQRP